MEKLLIILFVVALAASIEGSMCRPKSSFKIDCNTCICSENGKEYSCTAFNCPPMAYRQHFDVEKRPDGRIILTPKIIDTVDEDLTPTKRKHRDVKFSKDYETKQNDNDDDDYYYYDNNDEDEYEEYY